MFPTRLKIATVAVLAAGLLGGSVLVTHRMLADQFNGTVVDVAVTMGCGDYCPLVRAARHDDWNIPDPKDMTDDGFREVRGLIEQNVKDLLASLRRATPTG